MRQFTFKKKAQKGWGKIGFSNQIEIKFFDRVVGIIRKADGKEPFTIFLKIKRKIRVNNSTPFRWVWIQKYFTSELEAETYLKENAEQVQNTFDLYLGV